MTLKTELDDDDLLLFSYDTENRKAEYVKKVSVKDGKMEFTLKEGGHYFIAKRALASSLDESTDAEKQEIQDASDAAEDVPWDASEETVVLGKRGRYGYRCNDSGEKDRYGTLGADRTDRPGMLCGYWSGCI